MKLLGLVLTPLTLSAQLQIVDPSEDHVKWLLAVDRALDSPEYCQELSLLLEAPERDLEVSDTLREILATKCCGGQ